MVVDKFIKSSVLQISEETRGAYIILKIKDVKSKTDISFKMTKDNFIDVVNKLNELKDTV